MTNISSVHEAAFNAAGEAMCDLIEEHGLGRLSLHGYTGSGDRFHVLPDSGRAGKGETPAAALVDALRMVEEDKRDPKLTTPRQVIEAVKGLLNEEDPLRAKLDELPVA
jgi:hypothetical protein